MFFYFIGFCFLVSWGIVRFSDAIANRPSLESKLFGPHKGNALTKAIAGFEVCRRVSNSAAKVNYFLGVLALQGKFLELPIGKISNPEMVAHVMAAVSLLMFLLTVPLLAGALLGPSGD